ncbi:MULTISPECIES: 50S ribosomal protein L11 methyltransferase [Capnocytophaga]|uniref:Ribosomal protein L11 methyltransferase n=1 Tax=Capnocytophaga canis TaxID=1848903 RepID=A0A0B7IMM7_9FLAO|nr:MULTISPECIES: 50S ribosomal protein L11 methyltransferase [Capnocytophaga]ATA71972.1 50S ribosomal protein L11 methyltransferase [Capnocytophaga sp. H4358]RIY37352.1 50S ribosomal protein L11 methyltransferase [Capnocytophaga canis]CEN45358.1 Ribosomal protein L11 methyltransferase [Capnocytophaga canis]CEN51879.1 Ribosomal protein L11 methyltransferase [Capnocytophaga canis]GIM60765.1 ribosomal protein L11 methyltransferase [Capnocytophaga canis]
MNYIEYDFKIEPQGVASEILVAELAEWGFESFVDTERGILAYIQESLWNEHILDEIYILKSEEFLITYSFRTIEQVNWNEEWEKNFDPISVDGLCTVRAPFHPKTDTKYDIIIEPKMSFGTGHHETTYMMLQFLLQTDFSGKSVLDMGCGTSVLAIMSEKRGATKITAIDIDDWCVENSIENIQRNDCKCIEVKLGDASLLKNEHFDVVIANINRNILLNDLSLYAATLSQNGMVLLSGFYKSDMPVILEECSKHGLSFVENLERNEWVAVKCVKKD